MTANLDRFGSGITPSVPDEVGDCLGCHDTMYDYEAVTCPACGETVHQTCLKQCAHCGYNGCAHCLTKNSENLEFYCEDCNNPIAHAGRKCAKTGSFYHLKQYLTLRKRFLA